MNDDQKATAGAVGLGVAACAACCAVPIVAAVGTGALGPIGAGVAVLGGGVTFLWKRTRPPLHSVDADESVEPEGLTSSPERSAQPAATTA